MIIEDRTGMETDWKCGMARYWLTEWRAAGEEDAPVGGIVPVQEVWELELGAAFADAIAPILTGRLQPGEAVAMVTPTFRKVWGQEKADLLAGLIWGAALYVIPRLKQTFEFLQVENEVFYTTNKEVLYMVRPDVVMRRLSDQTVWVPDWKTTKWKDVRFLLKWPFAIQMHLQAAAVKQTHPEWDVQGSLVLGAYKGWLDEIRGGISSPFTYFYHNGGIGDREEWAASYVRGWNRIPAHEYFLSSLDNGIEGWVRHMAKKFPIVLEEQFPISQPILLNEVLLRTVMTERTARLNRIQAWRRLSGEARQRCLPLFFEHRTSNCVGCGYLHACWTPAVTQDPCGTGLYVPRVPNHELERQLKEDYDARIIRAKLVRTDEADGGEPASQAGGGSTGSEAV